jgi:hypothetical protein
VATVAPAAQSILDQASRLWPNRSTASDGTIGDPAHASRESDHNPDSRGIVHAADLTHDPAHGCDAHAQADAIRLRRKAGQEPRLKYVISNRRIASSSTGFNWAAYDGDNPHEHHAHFSVNSGAIENDTSPWFVQRGLSVADIRDLLEAVRNQGDLTREVIRNQGEMTRDALASVSHAQNVEIRRTIWRSFGKTKAEIDELEAALLAELAD